MQCAGTGAATSCQHIGKLIDMRSLSTLFTRRHWPLLLIAFAALSGCSVTADRDTAPDTRSEALPLADSPLATAITIPEPAAEPTSSETAARNNPLIERALGALGVRYRYGGNTPETGFDCSGFVRWIFQDLVAQLPRSAQALSQVTAPEVARDQLQPADLVFFRITRARNISHVGMYVGNGQFIHAPSSGGRVRVDLLDAPYWRARLVKARRWSQLHANTANNS